MVQKQLQTLYPAEYAQIKEKPNSAAALLYHVNFHHEGIARNKMVAAISSVGRLVGPEHDGFAAQGDGSALLAAAAEPKPLKVSCGQHKY